MHLGAPRAFVLERRELKVVTRRTHQGPPQANTVVEPVVEWISVRIDLPDVDRAVEKLHHTGRERGE